MLNKMTTFGAHIVKTMPLFFLLRKYIKNKTKSLSHVKDQSKVTLFNDVKELSPQSSGTLFPYTDTYGGHLR